MATADEPSLEPDPSASDPIRPGRPAHHKNPVDQWFEVFVYAPLGFALDARTLFPKFVDRGRNQVLLARMVGQYAVTRGSARAAEALGQSHAQAEALLQAVGLLPEDQDRAADADDVAAFEAETPTFSAPPAPRASSARSSGPSRSSTSRSAAIRSSADAGSARTARPSRSAASRARADAPDLHAVAEPDGTVDAADAVEVGSLAIPDYDNLSASQVVPRLGGLTPAELEDVRRYESAQRGRKTILGKITQLQSA